MSYIPQVFYISSIVSALSMLPFLAGFRASLFGTVVIFVAGNVVKCIASMDSTSSKSCFMTNVDDITWTLESSSSRKPLLNKQ